MPSNFTITDDLPVVEKGTLYVVATPIGHKDDITVRALKVLAGVDIVAAEDTRHTGRMLSFYKISSQLISYHEHNEAERTLQLVEKLQNGASVALVSDAGTPSVSDPGYRLICASIQAGVRIVPIPGVSAAITALSVSGLPTDAFIFLGFPPKKQTRRTAFLKEFENETRTLIFYESPKRLMMFLNDALMILGDRFTVLSREMTKKYEEFIRGPISTVLSALSDRKEIKGECTLIFEGKNKKKEDFSGSVENSISEYLSGSTESSGDLSRKIASKFGISRKKAYELILSEKENKREEKDNGEKNTNCSR